MSKDMSAIMWSCIIPPRVFLRTERGLNQAHKHINNKQNTYHVRRKQTIAHTTEVSVFMKYFLSTCHKWVIGAVHKQCQGFTRMWTLACGVSHKGPSETAGCKYYSIPSIMYFGNVAIIFLWQDLTYQARWILILKISFILCICVLSACMYTCTACVFSTWRVRRHGMAWSQS